MTQETNFAELQELKEQFALLSPLSSRLDYGTCPDNCFPHHGIPLGIHPADGCGGLDRVAVRLAVLPGFSTATPDVAQYDQCCRKGHPLSETAVADAAGYIDTQYRPNRVGSTDSLPL